MRLLRWALAVLALSLMVSPTVGTQHTSEAGSPEADAVTAGTSAANTVNTEVGIVAAPDPFQRHLIFYNNLPFTVWPVIQAPQASNCVDFIPQLLRIHVNFQKKDAGIPHGQSVTVALPKNKPCAKGGFYNAVRIFVFTGSATAYEDRLAAAHQTGQKTLPFAVSLITPICGASRESDPCWIGKATDSYALDSPAQLLEYTIISQDANGVAYLDPNNAQGVPFIDFDVSYVDQAYLPVAMSIDTGAVQYMGSSLAFEDTHAAADRLIPGFSTRLSNFLKSKATWAQYAAYGDLNFNNPNPTHRSIFADLLKVNGVGPSPRVPSGADLVQGTYAHLGSALYKPSWDGKTSKACFDPADKVNLRCQVELPRNKGQDCCPTPDNVMLGCCDQQNFFIDGVQASYDQATSQFTYTSAALEDLTRRWVQLVKDKINCETPPPSPVIAKDQQSFCTAFTRSVQFVWKEFMAQDASGAKECSRVVRDEDAFNRCMTSTILGYKIDTTNAQNIAEKCKACQASHGANCAPTCTIDRILNENVQALLRGVPWTPLGDPNKCQACPSSDPRLCSPTQCIWLDPEAVKSPQWHTDKFLHFWAPYDSVFNLNPYARLIHAPDALSAPGAYSFSIDDFYGNFGGPGTNLIIQMGGVSRLPNPEPYDPYKQYHVSAAKGWHHLRLCTNEDGTGGRRVDIPRPSGVGIPLGTPLSFYLPGGTRKDPCFISVFGDEAETTLVRFKLSEVTYTVTDTYTGVSHQVKGLSGVFASGRNHEPTPIDTFCKQYATAKLKEKCKANLSPVGRGNRDAYTSVADKCTSNLDAKCGRPLTTLNIPPLVVP